MSAKSKYSPARFTGIEEVDSVPEFGDLILMVVKGSVVNGYGKTKDIEKVLVDYQTALQETITTIRAGETPSEFFVPDLWHISFGRAKLFTPEDASRIYEAWLLGHCLGRKYMVQGEGIDHKLYPGTWFVSPQS